MRRLVCRGPYHGYCRRHDAAAISAQAVALVLHWVREVWSADDDKCRCAAAAKVSESDREKYKNGGIVHPDDEVLHAVRAGLLFF